MTQEAETIGALRAENEALRQRVAALQQENDSLALYRMFFEQFPIPTMLFGTDGVLFDINRKNEELINASRDTLAGSFSILNDVEAQEQGYLAGFQQALRGDVVSMPSTAYDVTRAGHEGQPDKPVIWTKTTFFPLYDSTGTLRCIGEISLDVTQRKMEEQVRRTTEQDLFSFKLLADASPVAIIMGDMQTTIHYANAAMHTMLKCDDTLIGRSFLSLFPDPLLSAATEAVTTTSQDGNWQGILAFQQSDGERILAQSTGYLLKNAQGEPIGLVGLFRDITEILYQNEALQASEERLKAIVEKTPVGVCITNEDQLFEYVNPAYCQIYHYTREELIGHPFTIVVPPEGRQRASEQHDTFLHEGTEIGGEWSVVTKEGTPLSILADAAAITGEDGQPKKVTFVVDITALKQAEDEQRKLQQQVIEAQQEAIRELSTPLIPLSHNVVLMPLIGAIDSRRAQMVMETLLEGIATYQADTAILDITGVMVVDTQVANALIQAAQAVRLLGAQVILTGIGPAMAQTLVHLGADLSSIITRGSLQSAVVEALSHAVAGR